MKAIKLIRTVALAIAVSGLSAVPASAGEQDQATEYKAAIEKAETARKKAASVGGEWRDTGKMIKQAEAAAKKGDHSAALKLAHDAYRQGVLGYRQAIGQKNADFPDYMR